MHPPPPPPLPEESDARVPARWSPVIEALKRLTDARPDVPQGIVGAVVAPVETRPDRAERDELDLRHLLGIVDYLFGVGPDVVTACRRGAVWHVSVRYPGPMHVVVRIGCAGRDEARTLELSYPDQQVTANLIDQALVVSTRNNQLSKDFFPAPDAAPGTGAMVRERVSRVAAAARRPLVRTRPRVAVMGGGIFGATCAIELADVADVTLFERRAELLTETSNDSQQRHHSGFHYPRSYDSIAEIRAARAAFDELYAAAIDRSFPAYYCTSATGVEIPADRYLAACRSNDLAFTVVDPPAGIVAPATVSLCLATDEGVYDVACLRRIASERLASHPSIDARVRTAVVSASLSTDGVKRLTVSGPGGTTVESFDYVVNATYAQRNMLARWFGFPLEPLRFDLYEHLLLRLPIPQVSVTIMDGPFTSLTGTGRDHQFILSHIHDSVSRSVIPEDGLPPEWPMPVSNAANMLRHSSRYLPVLAEATDIRSRWVTRAVNAYARDFDARPTVIADHGFGCWSVLGGKIITCVTNARDIARAIRAEQE